jgi:hypothetical protein
MRHWANLIYLAAGCLSAFFATPAIAAPGFINNRIAFQGLLQNSNGTPITNGTYNARFSIHTGGVANTVVWTKSAVPIVLVNGIFNALLSGADDSAVVLTPALIDVSGSDLTTSLQIDVAVDFAGNSSYSTTYNNIPIQAVPTAMLADTCLNVKAGAVGDTQVSSLSLSKLATSGASTSHSVYYNGTNWVPGLLTAANLTAGNYSSVITSGTYSISVSGGSVTLPAANNITYSGVSGNFDQSSSAGTFATGTGAVSLNGNVSIAGAKTFSTGTGNVSINGPVTSAITAAAGVNAGYTAGGTANAQTVTLAPAIASYSNGLTVTFLSVGTNTGAATLNVNALGAKNIFSNGSALVGGELAQSGWYTVIYDGTQFNLISTAGRVLNLWGGTVGGTANAITTTFPKIGAITPPAGTVVVFKATATNTGATTLSAGGSTAVAVQYNGQALAGGEIANASTYTLVSDGTVWQIQGPISKYGAVWGGTVGGTANAITTTYPLQGAIAPPAGTTVTFKATATNTGATTLAAGGGNATAIQYNAQALTGGEIVSGGTYTLVSDGTAWQIQGPIRLVSAATTLAAATTTQNGTTINATTVTVTGAAVGDAVACAPNSSPGAGPNTYTWSAWVSATSTVSIVISCNGSSAVCGAWTPVMKCAVFK